MEPHLLIFTPITPGGLHFATVQSVVGQRFTGEIRWEIGRCNPYPPPDTRNVLAQYSYARELALRGPYDALVTFEQDIIAPSHALSTLWEDGAAVVYGTYMLRHGLPVCNAMKYEGNHNLGMSLSLYSGALPKAIEAGRMIVSGVGFGCTLMRREVLEAISFRQDSSGNAPDMPFARDCLWMGIEQIARFDVACGHIHEGDILETQQSSTEGMVTVTALEDCTLLIGGQSVALAKGDSVEMSEAEAADYAGLGYVEISKGGAAPRGAGSTLQDKPELGDAPKVPTRKPLQG